MKYGCNKQKFSHFEDTPLPKKNNNKQQPIFNERTFISRRLIKLSDLFYKITENKVLLFFMLIFLFFQRPNISMGRNKQKDKQKGSGKGKKESAVFKVAGVRKPKIKSVNTNLKKVRAVSVVYN